MGYSPWSHKELDTTYQLNRHREWTYGRGERRGEGEMYGKSNMEIYITICKMDSQQEFAICLRKLKQGSVSIYRGGKGWEMGGKFRREEIYVYLWLIMLRFNRKQQNSMKQSPFNKNSKFRN